MSKKKKQRRKGKKMTKFQTAEVILSYLLRASLIFAITWASIHGLWFVVFASSVTLITSFLPNLLEKSFKFALPIEFELLIILAIYSSLFLGETINFYDIFWWWDIFLHGVISLSLGFVGFLIIYTLLDQGRIRASALIVAIFAFGFALSLGALWEIFEFGMDQLFNINMQKSGLVDTMSDLVVNSIAALTTSIIGYFYIKHPKKQSRVLKYLIGKYYEENEIKLVD